MRQLKKPKFSLRNQARLNELKTVVQKGSFRIDQLVKEKELALQETEALRRKNDELNDQIIDKAVEFKQIHLVLT